MASVHIIPGFTEGKWHIATFLHGLRKMGYSLEADVNAADYVIAHSGGCYEVPALHDNQILALINPTYWPDRSLSERGRRMFLQIIFSVRPGNKPLYHLNKTAHNIAYFFYHLQRNKRMITLATDFNLEQEIKHPKTILIRNYHDPWLTPNLEKLTQLNPKLQIARLSGEHDDCWLNPTLYIEIIENTFPPSTTV